ncbi:hypothetical protein [Frankia sp. AgW1.1]|uniref:hypothetical protein n=1 Tax=Frankia sp. AgW1.1 TaxID=1836971 RepID=UPI0019313FF7|nr:hypothetical protein [Frankia sp. AgW1.1]MBL7487056.1 hypothetical protein [Frankia sp. AgW1.1]
MTADPYIERRYDADDPYPASGAGFTGGGWDGEDATPTVPRPAWRRMPPKKDLAVRGLTASFDRSVPLFVAIPAVALTVGLSHWLPAGALIRAGWIIGFAFIAAAAGFQVLQAKTFRRRALLALWIVVAVGTLWQLAAGNG